MTVLLHKQDKINTTIQQYSNKTKQQKQFSNKTIEQYNNTTKNNTAIKQ